MPGRLLRIAAAAALLGALSTLALAPAGYAGASTPAKVAARSVAATSSVTTPTPVPAPAKVTFAVIGDYGVYRTQEVAVARLCKRWKASYVVTVGDNVYDSAPGSGTNRYYWSAGFCFGRWMAGVPRHRHKVVGKAEVNAFFPSLGNEDYDASGRAKAYRRYFTLPGKGFTSSSGNERYYDFVEGRIHYFMLDSDPREPRGVSARSKQAKWLKAALAASTSDWNIVVCHHPPYSSSEDGSSYYMRWPFKKWGADLVLSGHAHLYERVVRDGLTYITDGLGGGSIHSFSGGISGSQRRYNGNFGAMRGVMSGNKITFAFFTIGGTLIDRFTVPAHR